MAIEESSSVERMWQGWEDAERLLPGGTVTMSKVPNRSLHPHVPARIVRGKGCRVWDETGRSFIDYRNGLGPMTLGYANERLNQAVIRQLELGTLYGHPSPLEAELAERLVEKIPCAEQVRYLKTGGEAMGGAIRMARAYTKRPFIISCGYHGWINNTGGGIEKGNPPEIGALTRAARFGDIASFEAVAKEVGEDQVAALTLSMPYADIYPNHPFYQELRDLADRLGALLIFDEIVTGFRLRIGGAGEYFGVQPDLAVFSKGMAAGFPISAICGRTDVMSLAATIPISSTFAGETVGLAAALETMTIYEEEDVVGHLWARGEQLMNGLNRQFKEHVFPGEIKGLAPCSMLVMQPGAENASAQAEAWIDACYEHGVSFYRVIYPNFAHSEADINETLERCEQALASLKSRGV